MSAIKDETLSRPSQDTKNMWGEGLCVQKLNNDARLPEKKSEFAVGYDLFASEPISIDAWSRKLVPTKIAISMPYGVYGRIAPRSGLSVNSHIDVGAGVIDSDYQGEIKILLINQSDIPYTVQKNDRIAQLILEQCLYNIPVYDVANIVDIFGKSARGAKGFGSTGI